MTDRNERLKSIRERASRLDEIKKREMFEYSTHRFAKSGEMHPTYYWGEGFDCASKYLLALVERYEKALHTVGDRRLHLDGDACAFIAREALEAGERE